MLPLEREAILPRIDGIRRNILVHHYADINAQKLYATIKNHGADIESFPRYAKELLNHPEKFNLTVA